MPTGHAQPQRTTVAAYAERWLCAKSARLKPSVTAHYTAILADHILPHVGTTYLDALTRTDVIGWVAWAEKVIRPTGKTYAQETVRGWWRVLTCLLRDAAAEFGIPDPTMRVKPPKRSGGKRRERRTLDIRQLEVFLTSLRTVTPQRFAEAFTLAYTGLRPGEVYALRWEDLDLEGGAIPIDKAVWHQEVGRPKTDDSRVVPLTPLMIEVLQVHRREMILEQHRGVSTGLVFPSINGKYRGGGTLLKPFALATAEAQIDIHVTPQVLRRSFNTIMRAMKVDQVVLRAMMGHSSAEMTDRYTGVDLDAKKDAVIRLQGHIGQVP